MLLPLLFSQAGQNPFDAFDPQSLSATMGQSFTHKPAWLMEQEDKEAAKPAASLTAYTRSSPFPHCHCHVELDEVKG